MDWTLKLSLCCAVYISLISVVASSSSPQVTGPSYVTVNESFPKGGELVTFRVQDSDPNDNISVRFNSARTSEYVTFNLTGAINDRTVHIYTIKELDRDTGVTSVSLQFAITDTQYNQIYNTIDLYITDVNDNPPKFVHQPYSWSIKENAAVNSTIYSDISATDPDVGKSGQVSFRIEPDTQSTSTAQEYAATFHIDSVSGEVELVKALDYETNNYYQFTVIAEDGGGLSSNTTLVIRVLDVQDTPPFFTGIPYRSTINENVPVGYSVITLTARDGDTGVSNRIDYSIMPGHCSSLFGVDATGKITTMDAIDRDSGVVYNESGVCVLHVQASETNTSGQPQYGTNTSTTDVTVTINDQNDNVPKFLQSSYSASILENMPENVPITIVGSYELSVTDDDQEGDGYATMDITLQYTNDTECHDFTPSPTTVQGSGTIMIRVANKQVLDYEQRHNLTLWVVATEGADHSHVATATVVLNIEDMNDNSPQFNNTRNYDFHIDENSPNGTVIGTITASDADSPQFANVTYSLAGGNAAKFRVDKFTGEITTVCANCSESFDREKISVYYLTYTATDAGDRSNSKAIVIHLDDVNDNTPQFSRSVYTAFLDENDGQFNSSANPLLTVSATDNDEVNTNNSDIIYTITNVSDQAMVDNFSINAMTGQIFLKKPIDYEKLNHTLKGQFYITVEAKDNGSPPRSSSARVDITVQDINDNVPIFNHTSFTTNVFENATSNMTYDKVIATIAAYDLDGTKRNSDLNYYIIDGASGDFRIDSSSGKVTVQKNAQLDRETTPRYNVTIAAVDTGSPPKTSSTSLLVEVMDVNDVMPEFNQSSYSISVFENTTYATGLITCYATDIDENNNLLYSIEGIEAKNEGGIDVNSSLVLHYFGIHASNGTVFVSGTTDRETAHVITLYVMVKDTNAYNPPYQNVTVALTITLLDINDNYPRFETPANMSISENAEDGTILETITATDADVNRTIKYTLAVPGPFQIDENNGKLTKHGLIDREKNSTIHVDIVATDNGVPPLNSSLTVTVNVIDFNDNAPVFDANVTNPTLDITENSTIGMEVIRMHASDADIGPNSNVTYYIESGANGKFGIDTISGQITVLKPLDRETEPRYNLMIVAKDNPVKIAQQKSNRTEVTINLLDVNDNPPQFKHSLYNASIQEDIKIDVSVAKVQATDKDEGENSRLSYSIISEGYMFRINENTGDVYTNASLKDHVGSHIVDIMATDHGNPRKNATTSLHITVNDVNLHNPVIENIPPNNTIKIYECVRLNYLLYQFNFTDADHGNNAKVRFNISEIQDVVTDTFKMYENGSLIVIKDLNVQQKSSYKFQIYATDLGIPALESEKISINIEVIDVDNHLPSFSTDTIDMSVTENTTAVQTVGVVVAVDEDKDSQSCYTILDGHWASKFQINNLTGEIQTTEILDREALAPPLVITVKVHDCSILRPIGDECDNNTKIPESGYKPNITVSIDVRDIDDNPPVFNTKEITVGMRRNTDVDTVLDLNLRIGGNITDADSTPENRVNSWKFENAGDITMNLDGNVDGKSGTRACSDGVKRIFCIGRNGSVINNKLHKENLEGYFMVPVRVWDLGGNDTANIKIYLISDSQILIMTIFGEKEKVAESKNEILEAFGQVTQHTFVYDSIEDHKTPNGDVDTFKTNLHFHVVEPKTQRILSAKEAKSLVDSFYDKLHIAMQEHKVISIVSSTETLTEEDTSTKTTFILVAVIVALAVTLAIIIYVSIATRGKYKRKLKAATVKPVEKEAVVVENGLAIPGSNKYSKQSNPLLNVEIDEQKVQPDNLSLSSNNSLDQNEVDDARHEAPAYDTMEEREMTIDMYNDDGVPCYDEESPLDAALRLHEMQSAAVHTADSDTVVSPEKVHAFLNEAYDGEDYECTEI